MALRKKSSIGMSRGSLGTRTSSSALSAQREFIWRLMSCETLSVLTHAMRTGTSALPALTDSVQLVNEFWATPA